MPAWTANVLRCTATPRPPGTVVHAREGVRPRQHRPGGTPTCVLETGDKHFMVDTSSKPECISIDHLKPAHLDLDRSVELAQPLWRRRPSAPPLHSNKTPEGALAPAPVLQSGYGQTIRPPTCFHFILFKVNSGGRM